jgi:protein-disulfide isomerase
MKWSGERLIDAVVVVSAVGALVVASVVLASQRAAGPSDRATVVRAWQQYGEGGQRLGPEVAAVTLVEFGDYQCPACGVGEKHFEAVRRRNPEVAFVYRHFPLPAHEFAEGAAEAAECAAEQDRFPQMHPGLYQASALDLEALVDFARQAGVTDLDGFTKCLRDGRTRSRIEEDRRAARLI